MNRKEEEQFIKLGNKFAAEMSDLEKSIQERNDEIVELMERRDHLKRLLNGHYDTEDVEDGTAFAEAEDEQPTAFDDLLILFLQENPGSNRAEIEDYFGTYRKDKSFFESLLKRNKSRGTIISEGNSRATVWYATVQK